MESRVFIPTKIRVGYQDRADTFTKRLAYVIYFDARGRLCKERSWSGWRDQKIEPQDFENVPTSGFVLNKGITRYNWSDYGSNRRTMVRIYDPRGMEFEVTTENLVGLLMHTDCSRREITGDLVYAWHRGELLLLPCGSEEYTKAAKFTEMQGKKFSAKQLVEGYTYTTKSLETYIYLGRFDYWQWKTEYTGSGTKRERVKSRQHIFASLDGKTVKPIPSISTTIATVASEEIPEGFAKLVDRYLKSMESRAIKKLSLQPLTATEDAEVRSFKRHAWTLPSNGIADAWRFSSNGRPQDYYWQIRQPAALSNPGTLYRFPLRQLAFDGQEAVITEAYRIHGTCGELVVNGDLSNYGTLYIHYENGRKEKQP